MAQIETFEGLPIVDTGGRALISALDAKKISFPNGGADFGNSGDQLRSLGNGGVEWAAPGMPTYEQTEQAISDWLNAHPEATTTVADGAITYAKLNDALKRGLVYGFETVADMEAADTLTAGIICHTLGFHDSGDGGAAWYFVTDTADANDMDVIELNDSLYARMIPGDYVTPEQLGVIGYTATDWSSSSSYSKFDVVKHASSLYVALQSVPTGTSIDNTAYWYKCNKMEELSGVVNDLSDELDNKTYDKECNYIGRIYKKVLNSTKYAQGMCVTNDGYMYAVFTTGNDNNNNTLVLLVNMLTGVIIDQWNTTFAHANGIAYNEDEDMLYVCPNYDYTQTGNPLVNVMYKVNPANMAVIETINFDFSPHSICYDKVTGKMYLVSEGVDGYKLYSYDPQTKTAVFVNEIPDGADLFRITSQTPTAGPYQNIAAYNDNLYYLRSDYVMCLDNRGNLKHIFNFNPNVFVFEFREAQSIDFTNDGTMIIWGEAWAERKDDYALIAGINFGSFILSKRVQPLLINRKIEVHLNGTKNKNFNIFQYGDSNYCFTTWAEALASMRLYGTKIYLDGGTIEIDTNACEIPDLTIIQNTQNETIVKFTTQCRFRGNVRFEGYDNSHKLKIQSNARSYAFAINDFAIFRYVTFDATDLTSYMFTMYGLLQLQNVEAINTNNLNCVVYGASVGALVKLANLDASITTGSMLELGA